MSALTGPDDGPNDDDLARALAGVDKIDAALTRATDDFQRETADALRLLNTPGLAKVAYRAGQESASAATLRLTRRVQNLRDRAEAACEIARATGSATDQAKAEGLALALAIMEEQT